jgi:O-acetyl-ADP-ribose deacetylase
MEATFSGVKVEVAMGDITRQHGFDAVVNAANAQLRTGGGVAGAIHTAAGPGLEREARTLAPIRPGQAVITGGYSLPNKHVIHCLGPVYGVDLPSDVLLADCYRNALAVADENGLETVAFPAISTGIFGYPVAEAARVALKTVTETAPSLRHVRHVRFVLHDDRALRLHEAALADLAV